MTTTETCKEAEFRIGCLVDSPSPMLMSERELMGGMRVEGKGDTSDIKGAKILPM